MNKLLLAFLPASALLLLAAQQPDCRAVQTGTFDMVSKSGTRTRVTRTATRQTEKLEKTGELLSYRVKWLDGCTYELWPDASFFAKYPDAPRQMLLRVRITSVSAQGYAAETSSNIFPGTTRAEAVRVP